MPPYLFDPNQGLAYPTSGDMWNGEPDGIYPRRRRGPPNPPNSPNRRPGFIPNSLSSYIPPANSTAGLGPLNINRPNSVDGSFDARVLYGDRIANEIARLITQGQNRIGNPSGNSIPQLSGGAVPPIQHRDALRGLRFGDPPTPDDDGNMRPRADASLESSLNLFALLARNGFNRWPGVGQNPQPGMAPPIGPLGTISHTSGPAIPPSMIPSGIFPHGAGPPGSVPPGPTPPGAVPSGTAPFGVALAAIPMGAAPPGNPPPDTVPPAFGPPPGNPNIQRPMPAAGAPPPPPGPVPPPRWRLSDFDPELFPPREWNPNSLNAPRTQTADSQRPAPSGSRLGHRSLPSGSGPSLGRPLPRRYDPSNDRLLGGQSSNSIYHPSVRGNPSVSRDLDPTAPPFMPIIRRYFNGTEPASSSHARQGPPPLRSPSSPNFRSGRRSRGRNRNRVNGARNGNNDDNHETRRRRIQEDRDIRRRRRRRRRRRHAWRREALNLVNELQECGNRLSRVAGNEDGRLDRIMQRLNVLEEQARHWFIESSSSEPAGSRTESSAQLDDDLDAVMAAAEPVSEPEKPANDATEEAAHNPAELERGLEQEVSRQNLDSVTDDMEDAEPRRGSGN